jgi:uncharacterized membrane protein
MMISLRKFLAFLCLAAFVLAALTPVSAGLFWAILVPFLIFFGAAIVIWAEPQPEENRIPPLGSFSAIASRAPPRAASLI